MFLHTCDSRLVSDSSQRFSCSALLNNADMMVTTDHTPTPSCQRSDRLSTAAKHNRWAALSKTTYIIIIIIVAAVRCHRIFAVSIIFFTAQKHTRRSPVARMQYKLGTGPSDFHGSDGRLLGHIGHSSV